MNKGIHTIIPQIATQNIPHTPWKAASKPASPEPPEKSAVKAEFTILIIQPAKIAPSVIHIPCF